MTNGHATYINSTRAQFRAARVMCCVPQKYSGAPSSSYIALPFSVTVKASIESAFPFEEPFAPKSSAQVSTSVRPLVVRPKYNELKLGRFRPHRLMGRFSDEERIYVEKKAHASKLSVNEYIRAAALASDYKSSANPELVKALQALNLELTRQGTNLNQIAKHLNNGTASPAEAEGMLGIIARSHIQTHRAIRAALSSEKEPQQ